MSTPTIADVNTDEIRGSRFRQLMQERPIVVLLGVFVILYLFTAAQDPTMLSSAGFRSTLLLAAPLGIFAAAQTICMLTGGMDLSVTMIANFAAYVAASQASNGPVQALVLALAVGLAAGAINGIGVGVFNVNPIIMTLGMSSVLLGTVSVGLVGGGFLSGSVSILPQIAHIGSGTLFGPLPANFAVWIAVAAIVILGLTYTGLGRSIYAMGDNPLACRLGGIRSWQVYLAVYVLAGLLAAVGGLVFSGITSSVGPSQTDIYLLPSVAAAVIGGTSILGGIGGYGGTMVGALILTVLNRLLLTLDTSEAIRQIVYGLIVLVLVWVYVKISGQRTE
jgi:ribose transport system permease protein